MNLKVVAYYTNDFYMKKAQELSLSLGRFGVTYEITKVSGPQTWQEAVCHKPKFILDALLSSSCDVLIYTDSDSKLLQPIKWMDLVGDIAYVPFQRKQSFPEEALTGTMAFKNTMEVRAFVLEWIGATEKWKSTDTPEQHSFLEVLSHCAINVQRLGPEWCFIFDDMKEMFPDAKPIFTHYQASRQYKAIEKGQPIQDPPEAEEVTEYIPDPSEWTRSKGAGK